MPDFSSPLVLVILLVSALNVPLFYVMCNAKDDQSARKWMLMAVLVNMIYVPFILWCMFAEPDSGADAKRDSLLLGSQPHRDFSSRWLEQWTHNPWVLGSTPRGPTIFVPSLAASGGVSC